MTSGGGGGGGAAAFTWKVASVCAGFGSSATACSYVPRSLAGQSLQSLRSWSRDPHPKQVLAWSMYRVVIFVFSSKVVKDWGMCLSSLIQAPVPRLDGGSPPRDMVGTEHYCTEVLKYHHHLVSLVSSGTDAYDSRQS